MGKDYYEEGYRQSINDFKEKKGYKPHKLSNLPELTRSSKNTDEFLRGYRSGYDYCLNQVMRQEARNTLKPSEPKMRSGELDQLHQSLNKTPKNEPEYG